MNYLNDKMNIKMNEHVTPQQVSDALRTIEEKGPNWVRPFVKIIRAFIAQQDDKITRRNYQIENLRKKLMSGRVIENADTYYNK